MMGRLEHFVDTVVGIVLMVCVTVVLAVVIATFILGIGDDVEPEPKPVFDEQEILVVEESIDLDCIE